MNKTLVIKLFSLLAILTMLFSGVFTEGRLLAFSEVQTARADGYPQLSIHINENSVYVFDWHSENDVTVTIDDPITATSPDFSSSPMNWNPAGQYYYLNLDSSFTLTPGQIVSMTDGSTTKTITVVPFAITHIDLINDTISGQTAPYANADVDIGPDNLIKRYLNADENGFWTVNFSIPGSEPNEQQLFQLTAGSTGQAYTVDEDGDTVQVNWNVPNPRIDAHLSENRIEAAGWPLNVNLDLTINGAGTSYTTSQAAIADPNDSSRGYADFELNADYTLAPGQVVTISDGNIIKSLTVMDLYVSSYDFKAKTVTGHSDPNAQVQVSIWAANGGSRMVTADGNGSWQASFDLSSGAFSPGSGGDVTAYDADGDWTVSRINMGNIFAYTDYKFIELQNCTKYRPYTLTIDDPTNGPGVDYSDTETSVLGENELGYVSFWTGEFQPVAGDVITITGGHDVKSLVIAPRGSISFDTINDIISGVNQPDGMVNINPTQDSRNVLTDSSGAWTVDFNHPGPNGEPVVDITPGMGIWTAIFDAYGDQVDYYWNVPNPRIEVRANIHQIRGWDWTMGETVTLEVGGQSFQSVVTEAPWDANTHYVEFNLGGIYDIKPGDIVSLSDANITKTTIVTGLEMTGFDVVNDTVSGKAEAGTTIDLWANDGSNNYNRHVTADENGLWTADFAHYGSAADEQNTMDIVPGTWVDSQQVDGDGDNTMFGVNVPNPRIDAHLSENRIEAFDWPMGRNLTLTISGGDTPYAADLLTTGAPWDGSISYASFELGPDFFLVPGQVVTVTDGHLTKSLTVMDLYVSSYDFKAKTVTGHSDAKAQVQVSIWAANGESIMVSADDDGSWQASFDPSSGAFAPWTSGEVRSSDTDGNTTVYRTNMGMLDIWPEYDIAYSGCTKYRQYTLNLHYFSDGAWQDLTKTQTSALSEDGATGFVDFMLNGLVLHAGDVITVSSGHDVRIRVVTPRGSISFDIVNDLISGVNQPNTYLNIATPLGWRTVKTDTEGNWSIDYKVADPNGSPSEDIRPGMSGGVHEYDAFGNSVGYGWNIPNPRFDVRANVDQVQGWDWTMGDTVTLKVGDQIITHTVAGAPWDENTPYVEFNLGGTYDIKPGDTVSLSNGSITKTTIVTNLELTNFDVVNDTVSGIAQPGSTVDLWASDGSNNFNRHVTADDQGYWLADFSQYGTAADEQNTIVLAPGTLVDSQQVDEDGDNTMYGMNVPNPTITANPGSHWVYGQSWPLGSTLTMTIGQYTDTSTTVVAPWDPNVVEAWFDLPGNVNLVQGDVVTITDGITTRSLTIIDLKVTKLDVANNTLTGTSLPGVFITAVPNVSAGWRYATTDENGAWSMAPDPEGFVLSPGFSGYIAVSDAANNWQLTDWQVPTQWFDIYLQSNLLFAVGWDKGAQLTLEVTNSHGKVLKKITTTVTTAPWDPNVPAVDFSTTGFDFQPGQVVTVSGDGISKTYVIANPKVTRMDVIADTISGTGNPGNPIQVWANQGDQVCKRWTTVDEKGKWTVSFAPSTNPSDTPGSFDLVPGSAGSMMEGDASGDQTWIDTWIIPAPKSGSVLGAGWFNSPAGAYPANPALTGKAAFTLAVSYVEKKPVPQGAVLFSFKDSVFTSSTFDWMTINNGRMQLTGSGKVNGKGSYGFMIITAKDGKGNTTFRIRIWQKDSGLVVYDNMPGAADSEVPLTPVKGGAIKLAQ